MSIWRGLLTCAVGAAFLSIEFPAAAQSESEDVIAANEEAARATICEILDAQRAYVTDYGWCAAKLDALSTPDPPYLSWDGPLGNQGYDFAMISNGSRYVINATPVENGVTGIEHYFADFTRRIHYEIGSPADWYSPLYPGNPCAPALDAVANENLAISDLCTLQQVLEFWRAITSAYPESFDAINLLGVFFCEWTQPRHGYVFLLTGAADAYVLTADPVAFGESGNRGFYTDETGVIREEWGAAADVTSDPVSESCSDPNECLSPIIPNDLAIPDRLCTIHHAQLLYHHRNGAYASSFRKLKCYLDGDWERVILGHNFVMCGRGDDYSGNADPVDMNSSGVRGFYMDETGIIRFALGTCGNESSEPTGTVCPGLSEEEQEGEDLTIHTADQNGDYQIGLSELLRVIQLYNSGGYHCAAGSEDGYAPGTDDQMCPPHNSDYSDQDWVISLSELLRLVQFYNCRECGYHACPGENTEDGFCTRAVIMNIPQGWVKCGSSPRNPPMRGFLVIKLYFGARLGLWFQSESATSKTGSLPSATW